MMRYPSKWAMELVLSLSLFVSVAVLVFALAEGGG
jgi:hypothetical protein